MEYKIQKIIRYLNTVKTLCTYGAVAELLGVNSRSVGLHLVLSTSPKLRHTSVFK